jgi:hypothetical protein
MRRFTMLCLAMLACGKAPAPVAATVAVQPMQPAPPDAAAPVASVEPAPEVASDTLPQPPPPEVLDAQMAEMMRQPRWNDRMPDDGTGKPAVVVPLAPATAYDVGPDTIVLLRRTQCFGSCPVYSVGVRGDGSVHFYGESYTATNGYASANIGVAAVRNLLAFMRAKSFRSLHTRYPGMATDHPTYIVMLRQGQALKYVDRDETNRSEPALEAIEKEIDRVAGTAQWVGPSTPNQSTQSTPPIPTADFMRMAGPRLHAIEKACALGQTVTLNLQVSVDMFGGAELHGGSYPATAAASYACLQKKVPTLFFPLAGHYQGSTLTFSLSP